MIRHTYIGEIKGRLDNWHYEQDKTMPYALAGKCLFCTLGTNGKLESGTIIGRTEDSRYVVCAKGYLYELGEPAPAFGAHTPNLKERIMQFLPVFDAMAPEIHAPAL